MTYALDHIKENNFIERGQYESILRCDIKERTENSKLAEKKIKIEDLRTILFVSRLRLVEMMQY